jgi:hypothetical protein
MTVKNSSVPAARSAAFVAMAAIALGFAGAVHAQQPPAPAQGAQKSLQPPATVYEDMAAQRFTLQPQGGNRAILQSEDSQEVMVLRAVPAQRGDTYWTNDVGETVLRQSEQGSVTSFIGSENGSPASVVAYGPTVGPPTSTASLEHKSREVAEKLSRLAGHEVTVFGALAFANFEAWAVDALDNVLRGAEEANGPAGRVVSKLNAVRLEKGAKADVSFTNGELVLEVNPADGYAGRPSSDAVAKALTQARSSG